MGILIIVITVGIIEFLLYRMCDKDKWREDRKYKMFFINFSLWLNIYSGLYLYFLYSKNINYLLNICGLLFVSLNILGYEKFKFKDERIIGIVRKYSIVICVFYFLADLIIKIIY